MRDSPKLLPPITLNDTYVPQFTYEYLRAQLNEVLQHGYTPVRCCDYAKARDSRPSDQRLWVNRVDIDFSLKKTDVVRRVFAEKMIPATFFVRLHAPEYNPFSFEGYRILKQLISDGHEIGYHSEVVDEAHIWMEDPVACLRRDIAVLEEMLGVPVVGAASHGGMTGLNNLDFWGEHRPSEFGLAYEAYDREPEFNLFHESFYVSDSEWTRWKCYDHGMIVNGDRRSLGEHAADHHAVLYTLLHPDTYFENHFYE